MTTKKKSPASPKRRSSPKTTRNSKAPVTGVRRFVKALTASAVAAFGIASFILNPDWRDELESYLPQLGWPGQEQTAPLAVDAQGYTQTRFNECPQFFPRGQLPMVPTAPSLRELCYDAFAILHNGQTKTPVLVAQRLNRQMLVRAQAVERTDRFFADARLPSAERAQLADYRGSGYSRGHMAPAADMHTANAMDQSFSLANMVPQNQSHNAGAWSRIEQDTRKYIMHAKGDVYVFTGPVYQGRRETIGEGRVAVPSHLYKLVYDSAANRSWVHWQENDPDSKAGPPISYDEFV